MFTQDPKEVPMIVKLCYVCYVLLFCADGMWKPVWNFWRKSLMRTWVQKLWVWCSIAQCSTCIVWWRPCWFSVLRSYVFWILMISSHQARQKAVGELTTASPGRWTHCVLLKWPDWPDQTMIKLWSNIPIYSYTVYSNQVELVELLILEPGSRKRQHVYIQGMACARMGCLYLCSSTGNQTRCLSTWRLARFKHGLPTCSHAVIVYIEKSREQAACKGFNSRYSSHSNCAHK